MPKARRRMLTHRLHGAEGGQGSGVLCLRRPHRRHLPHRRSTLASPGQTLRSSRSVFHYKKQFPMNKKGWHY